MPIPKVSVSSVVDEGTEFTLVIPRVNGKITLKDRLSSFLGLFVFLNEVCHDILLEKGKRQLNRLGLVLLS